MKPICPYSTIAPTRPIQAKPSGVLPKTNVDHEVIVRVVVASNDLQSQRNIVMT